MDIAWQRESLAAQFLACADDALVSCELTWCGVFGDLLWLPRPGLMEHAEYAQTDPAFIVEGYSRYVALARVNGEIRYFAMGLSAFLEARSIREGGRHEAALRDGDDFELGSFASVEAAVEFTTRYLGGTPFADIEVARRPPA